MIRKADINDCEAVYSLICELENNSLPYCAFADIYGRQVPDENYCCLVYELDGCITGLVNMRFEYQLHHAERIAEITEFVVKEAHRGRGIGGKLLTAACECARENGCAQIEAASNKKRLAAHRFYLREKMEKSHYKFTARL